MANLGVCPECPSGTRERILIAGKCPYHNEQPAGKKSSASGKEIPEIGKKVAESVKKRPIPGNKKPKAGKKARKPIPRRGKKRAAQEREYGPKAAAYVAAHPKCEADLPYCRKKSDQLHHIEGREGDRLNDEDNFLAVCHSCHRRITDNSKEAIEKGFSKYRNGPARKK